MINEFSILGPKNLAVPMKRIKELFSQFGLLCFTIDDYSGFLSRKPYELSFSPVRINNKIGTRIKMKAYDCVIDDSIYFSEDDIIEFLYQNSAALRREEKILEDTFKDDLMRYLDE